MQRKGDINRHEILTRLPAQQHVGNDAESLEWRGGIILGNLAADDNSSAADDLFDCGLGQFPTDIVLIDIDINETQYWPPERQLSSRLIEPNNERPALRRARATHLGAGATLLCPRPI